MNDTAVSPEPVVLIIADISGYTRYMTANVKTLAHSQAIITELVKAIVRQVELPLEVAKLEGDAVFLYGRKGAGGRSWEAHKRVIGEKLFAFFMVFREKANELAYSTTCTCNACTHIESLRLKVIVHSGEALFHQVFHFQELAGVDVIIVHRLLKNSIAASQYLLVTNAAQKDIEVPANTRLVHGAETYDDIGKVNFGVYYPEPASVSSMPEEPASRPGFAERFVTAWKFFLRLWFKPLGALSTGGQREFQHLPSGASRAARIGFALLTLLLTPVYVPVGAARVVLRALKDRGPGSRGNGGDEHEHAPDGSCCRKNGG